MDFCQFVADIQKDPTKIITNLKVGQLIALKNHLTTCQKCDDIVNEVFEKGKDIPSKPDSSRYN